MPNDLHRLAVTVTDASGRTSRWAFDEPNPANIPRGLGFGTAMPGLYKDSTLSLARPIDVDSADLNLYDDLRIYGPGNVTIWEGRVVQLPREHGDNFSVQVGCVGHAAHLRDDPSFTAVYVDLDPSHWQGPTSNRQLTSATANEPQNDYTATASSSGITFIGATGQAISNKSTAMLMYLLPPGLGLVKAMYKGIEANLTSVEAATLFGADADDMTTGAITTALTLDNTLRTATPASVKRYLMLRAYASATHTPAAAAPFNRQFTKLAVYGNHGLTSRANGADPDGFYGSDLVADIVSRGAPLLNYTSGAGGSIESDTFVIPHAVYAEPTTAEDAILDINKYYLKEWGVGAGKQFFWRSPDPDRLTWEARLSDGAKISLEGDDANNVFNGVIVQYTDPTGVSKSVGPPGVTSVDATDSTLADTSATNPINAHGIPRRCAILRVSQVTTQAGAIQIGGVWLVEHSIPQRRGTLTLTGNATHPTKGLRPVYEIQAGDWVKIPDHSNDQPRRIIEQRFDLDSLTTTLSLDNTVFKIEALMERMAISLVGVL